MNKTTDLDRIIDFLQSVKDCGEENPKVKITYPNGNSLFLFFKDTIALSRFIVFKLDLSYELFPEPKVEYRKFNKQEMFDKFSKGSVLLNKETETEWEFVGVQIYKDGSGAYTPNEDEYPDTTYTPEELLAEFTELDGSPCGMPVEKESAVNPTLKKLVKESIEKINEINEII